MATIASLSVSCSRKHVTLPLSFSLIIIPFLFPSNFTGFIFLSYFLCRGGIFVVGVFLLFVFGLCARLPNINTDAYFFFFQFILSVSFTCSCFYYTYCFGKPCLLFWLLHLHFLLYHFLTLSFPHLSRAPNYFAVLSSSQYKLQNWNLASNDLNQSYFT